MPEMYFHSTLLWPITREARDRALATASQATTPYAWNSDTIISVILAAASTEAFINEFAELLAHHRQVFGPASLSSALSACAHAVAEVEKSRGSLSQKYLTASEKLSGKMFEKGVNPYRDFDVLIKLRNDLMHLKGQSTSGPESLQPPKHIIALQQRGLVHVPPPNTTMSWFHMLQTPMLADWACETAHAMILAVLAMVPDDPTVPTRDPCWALKQQFRGLPLPPTPPLSAAA